MGASRYFSSTELWLIKFVRSVVWRGNIAKTCAFYYIALVLLSLVFAPWWSPAGPYSEGQIHWAPIFYPPNVPGRTPHLMFEQILLVWGALGMLTAAIVWVTRRQN